MDKKNFLEELFKNKPAKITAESDDKGIMSIMLEGRGIELLALSVAISQKVLEGCPMTVSEYCGLLKYIELEQNKDKSKEQKDVENVIIDKMLKDIFK